MEKKVNNTGRILALKKNPTVLTSVQITSKGEDMDKCVLFIFFSSASKGQSFKAGFARKVITG